MSRVMIFSRRFPLKHSKGGKRTLFVEMLWNTIETGSPRWWKYFRERYFENVITKANPGYSELELKAFLHYNPLSDDLVGQKWHTIRPGKKWKSGDRFSPRVWIGIPYRSKQLCIMGDMEVTSVWEFEIDPLTLDIKVDGLSIDKELLKNIAKNDGLQEEDLLEWLGYPKAFSGQIVCWSKDPQFYMYEWLRNRRPVYPLVSPPDIIFIMSGGIV